eukprot:scaffold220564_cov15-Tisochrysis_lutea.AAC.1
MVEEDTAAAAAAVARAGSSARAACNPSRLRVPALDLQIHQGAAAASPHTHAVARLSSAQTWPSCHPSGRAKVGAVVKVVAAAAGPRCIANTHQSAR